MLKYYIEYADTFKKRFKGLMFKKSIPKKYILALYPCKQVHGMFMFMTISLIILDKDKKVIDKVKEFKPWTISRLYNDGYYVLEFSDDDIYEEISIGEIVEI